MGVENNSDNYDIPKSEYEPARPRNELDDILDKARESRPEYTHTRDELVDIFNEDHFDQDYALRRIEKWNKKEEETGKFVGNFWSCNRIRCKHGEVKEYYYPEKQGFRIGYGLKQ